MLTHEQTNEIVTTLNQLPIDKIAAVRDFVFFLHERYGKQDNGPGQASSLAERRAKTAELLAWSRAHSITLPPGSPTAVELIREGRGE